jgi:hypothetical protein
LVQKGIVASRTDFPTLLKGAITNGLVTVLGDGGTRAIVFHLNLTDSDFADPEKFHDKLSRLFTAGTPALEKVIIAEMYVRLGVPLPSVIDGSFAKYVSNARKLAKDKESKRER